MIYVHYLHWHVLAAPHWDYFDMHPCWDSCTEYAASVNIRDDLSKPQYPTLYNTEKETVVGWFQPNNSSWPRGAVAVVMAVSDFLSITGRDARVR